jgi:N-acetyl-anhydromuramyl-L-alanine amidase AmpD
VKILSWFQKLWRKPSNAGRPPTSQNSCSSSKSNSTSAPSTTQKAVASKPLSQAAPAKGYPETKARTPNVSAKAITPKAIVLHHSGGSYSGGVSWIKSPASRVSYHVLVAQDGRRTVFASPTQRTWHAGKSEWRGRGDLNSWSVGASFAGDTNREPLTPEQIDSMACYLVPIMRQYGLTINDVTDHRTVSPGRKSDLKPSELARFKAYLGKALSLPYFV